MVYQGLLAVSSCQWTAHQSETRLQCLLILLSMAPVDLLDGRDILLEVSDRVFPCLQSLGEQAGGLHMASVSAALSQTDTPKTRTVEGSVSGTASSLMALRFVVARDGSSEVLVGEVGVAMMSSSRFGAYLGDRTSEGKKRCRFGGGVVSKFEIKDKRFAWQSSKGT